MYAQGESHYSMEIQNLEEEEEVKVEILSLSLSLSHHMGPSQLC